MEYKIFKSSDTNVSKFVFEKETEGSVKPIAVEAVLYRYGEYRKRTVVCCSTQCGCPMGCSFCGTGQFFVRNLTASEIVEQVDTVLSTIDCETSEIEKLQLMFMSMGEPFLNYENLEKAIRTLSAKYPNAQLLVSTSAPAIMLITNFFDRFKKLSQEISKVGIQFSVHESTDENRRKLVHGRCMTLKEMGELGEEWAKATGRKPFFNYCVHEGNNTQEDVDRLAKNFNVDVWECTLSVICEKDDTVKNAIESQLELISAFAEKMRDKGFSLRVFNPAGQDDIGGGCGQLWYFQKWLKEQKYGESSETCDQCGVYQNGSRTYRTDEAPLNKTNKDLFEKIYKEHHDDFVKDNERRDDDKKLTEKEIRLYSKMYAIDAVVKDAVKRGDVSLKLGVSGDYVCDHGKERQVRLFDVIIANLGGLLFDKLSRPLLVMEEPAEEIKGYYTYWGEKEEDTAIMYYSLHVD